MSVYNYSAPLLRGKEKSLSDFEGKTLLVVNTASKCGFTPQFEGLETLYSKYKDNDFEVLGFPCNQFGNQEPGDAKSISEGCMMNYGVSFTMFDKIEVNGKNAHPLYSHLKKEKGGVLGSRIKWNFTKFLVDREGRVIKRFAPTTKPEAIESYLKKNNFV